MFKKLLTAIKTKLINFKTMLKKKFFPKKQKTVAQKEAEAIEQVRNHWINQVKLAISKLPEKKRPYWTNRLQQCGTADSAIKILVMIKNHPDSIEKNKNVSRETVAG